MLSPTVLTRPSSGYEKSLFIDNVDEFTCAVCHNVMNQPSETNCGHVFCTKCITSSLERNDYCPVCRENLLCVTSGTFKIHASKRLERIINNLEVKCDHKQNEEICPWTGTLQEYNENHCEQCSLRNSDCPYICYGCTFKNRNLQELEAHLEDCETQHLWLYGRHMSEELDDHVSKLRSQMLSVRDSNAKIDQLVDENQLLEMRIMNLEEIMDNSTLENRQNETYQDGILPAPEVFFERHILPVLQRNENGDSQNNSGSRRRRSRRNSQSLNRASINISGIINENGLFPQTWSTSGRRGGHNQTYTGLYHDEEMEREFQRLRARFENENRSIQE